MKYLVRVALVVVLSIGTLGLWSGSVAHASPSGDFLAKINGLRASKGIAPLSTDGRLQGLAQPWANKLAADRALSHRSDLSNTPGNWTSVGENVGTGPSVDAIFNALVASPGHYKNMVNPAFTSIGVGVATGSDGRLYTAHNFAAYPGAAVPAPGAKSATVPAPAKKASPPASSTRKAATPVTTAPKPTTTTTAAPQPESTPAPAANLAPEPVRIPSSQIVQGFNEIAALSTQG